MTRISKTLTGEKASNHQGVMRKYAVLVAGGSGQRMGSEVPKQFIEVAGKPVLMHTLEVFADYDPDIELIVVLPVEQTERWRNLCLKHGVKIAHQVAAGGTERFFSVKNGLELISGDGIVFIHDGVRPLVSRETLEKCFRMTEKAGNALPVIPVSESVRMEDSGQNHTIDRTKVMLVQTPQTFRVSLIREAYNQPFDPKFTDDASVLENSGYAINLTEGNRENVKITWPNDLILAGILLSEKNKPH
jgi:2-C-methyl-D-erythritol 4-phosphate cytidylyltransferase